jgi:hypothetical protein
MRRPLPLALLVLLAGCDEMGRQPKALPYQSNSFFEDNRVMRQPPPGTVSRDRRGKSSRMLTGLQQPGQLDGGYLEEIPLELTLGEIPLELTRGFVERGQHAFQIYCATCHGLLGDGESQVARNMALRPPPSLHTLPEYPDGYSYFVISEGFGLMPGYKDKLAAEERWAVVAYVRALRRSQRARLEDVPPELRPLLLATDGGTP